MTEIDPDISGHDSDAAICHSDHVTTATSDIFRMTGFNQALHLLRFYGRPWLTIAAVAAIAALITGFMIDIVWIIVFLMIVFLIFPALLAFLYIFYGMVPETAMNITPHRLLFGEDGIQSQIFVRIQPSQENNGKSQFELRHTVTVPLSAVKSVSAGLSSATLVLKGAHPAFIWIPVEAFRSEQEFSKAIDIVFRQLRHFTKHDDNQTDIYR